VRFSDGDARITGMVASFGQRTNEYAVVLSFEKGVNADAASSFLEAYNLSEIDGGDDGMCAVLANLINKYTYTVGDVDPLSASSDAMEASILAKFQHEVDRMEECVRIAADHAASARRSWAVQGENGIDMNESDLIRSSVHAAFASYKSTLIMQMRHQPLGTREWLQMFESYMCFACAEDYGLGFLDFVLG
jgi:hypothetical protein